MSSNYDFSHPELWGREGNGKVWRQGEICGRTDGGGFRDKNENGLGNTTFKKREEHMERGKEYAIQVDFNICRREYLREIGDCKVIAGDNVAKQHRLLVCRMTCETNKRKIAKAEPRIKWWK